MTTTTPRRCAIQCALHLSDKCNRCTVPDQNGTPHCPAPDCLQPLTFIGQTTGGDKVRYACHSLKGCGQTIQFPIAEEDTEAALQRRRKEEDQKVQARKRTRNRRRLGGAARTP